LSFSTEKENEGLQTPCGTIAYTGKKKGKEKKDEKAKRPRE
jgi:hypothetical protein